MREKIFARCDRTNAIDWANTTAAIDADAELRLWHGARKEKFKLTDLSNALKTGAECVSYSVRGQGSECAVLDLAWHFGSLQSLFRLLDSLPWEKARYGWEKQSHALGGIHYTVQRLAQKGVRTFSPLHLHRIKPLKRAPKKWTVRSAYRAIVNGQFDWLKCDGQYSDDYRRDAAHNYHKGEISEHLAFIQRIIENPSGWRVRVKDGEGQVIRLNCHHFDNNSFKFNPEAAKERSLESA